MDSITVRIFHNRETPEAHARGYEYGDTLDQVYCGEKRLPYREFAETSLEFIYEQNRWVDGSFPWYEEARSIAVGDVIVLDNKVYSIEPIGFKELDPVHACLEELV